MRQRQFGSWKASVLLLAAATPSLLGQPPAPPAPPTPPAPARTAAARAGELVLPFELSSNKIYMETKINGEGPFPFVLDTGAPFTVLDWNLAQHLNIPVSGVGEVGGAGAATVRLGRAEGVRVTVAGLRYRPPSVEVIALNQILSTAEGRPVQGLIGGDILQRFVSEFDFEAKEVHLHDAAEFAYTGTGTRVPVQIDGHVLANATVKFGAREPISGKFIIDTGARIAVSLNTHVVDRHELLGADVKHITTTIGWGIGGPIDHGLARAEALEINGVRFERPTVTLSQDTKGIFSSTRIAGVIGNEVLKRCRVFFDYSRDEVILEPVVSAMARPFPADAAGLFLTAAGPELRIYTIRTVVAGSPAAEAGFKAGDVIEKVDAGPASRFTLEQLRELLREPDRTLEFNILRGIEAKKIKLTTRPLI